MGEKRFSAVLWALIVILLAPVGIAAEPTMKIGILSGLTGMASKWNHYQNNGARLARDEFAAAGVPVELVFEDSQTLGSKALSGFNSKPTACSI